MAFGIVNLLEQGICLALLCLFLDVRSLGVLTALQMLHFVFLWYAAYHDVTLLSFTRNILLQMKTPRKVILFSRLKHRDGVVACTLCHVYIFFQSL